MQIVVPRLTIILINAEVTLNINPSYVVNSAVQTTDATKASVVGFKYNYSGIKIFIIRRNSFLSVLFYGKNTVLSILFKLLNLCFFLTFGWPSILIISKMTLYWLVKSLKISIMYAFFKTWCFKWKWQTHISGNILTSKVIFYKIFEIGHE